MDAQAHDVTLLLKRARNGDKAAENRLYEIVMPELRRMAQQLLDRERPNHPLQATELINMMYVRLSSAKLSLRDRADFFAIAGRTMRHELWDYPPFPPAGPIRPLGRGGFIQKDGYLDCTVTVNELLDDLSEAMPLECSIVELKLFFGTTDAETAEVLGLPLRTMQKKWQDARIWLYERAEGQQWKPAKPPRKGISMSATN